MIYSFATSEFIMAIAALEGYEDANGKALDMWDQVGLFCHTIFVILSSIHSTRS